MEALKLILFLLAAVAASSILDKFLPRLSLPIVQIVLGAIIAVFVQTPFENGIDTEILLILFIAPLHFNESRHVDSGELWANRWGIASLAIGLVIAIVLSVGFTLNALMPTIPLALAFAFGAAMGSTDAVAVTELSKGFKFGRHHKTLLEGEALFNDVTGTVIFQCSIGLAVSGTLSIIHAGEEFMLDMFGGLVGGVVLGVIAWGILEMIRRLGIDKPTLHVTLELLLPFVIYLIAKQLHIGAVIAVVAAGMMMSVLPHKHNAQMARQKLQSKSVWDTLTYILNGVIFVILGMQLPRVFQPLSDGTAADPAFVIGIILILCVVLEGVRFVWILLMDLVHARAIGEKASSCFTSKSLKGTLAMAFAGPKGGITLSLMLTLPMVLQADVVFASRGLLISIASGVILCTLLLANFAVPVLVPHKNQAQRTSSQIDAEIRIIEMTIESVFADSHLTGTYRAEKGKASTADPAGTPRICDIDISDVDGPATVIVMKRYADQLGALIPKASNKVAEEARGIIAKCDELYRSIENIGNEVNRLDSDEAEYSDDESDASKGIAGHFRELRQVYDAVEDVQTQALARELEIIKAMRNAGQIAPDQAKQLRNDVYIQQLTL